MAKVARGGRQPRFGLVPPLPRQESAFRRNKKKPLSPLKITFLLRRDGFNDQRSQLKQSRVVASSPSGEASDNV